MAGQRSESLLDVDSREFIAGLEKAIANMHIRSKPALNRVGIRIANAAKQHCPVDSGRLRSAIAAHPGQDAVGPYIDVGVTLADLKAAPAGNPAKGKGQKPKLVGVNYALFVEMGTSKMRAQPFMRPALAEVSGYASQMLAEGIVRGGQGASIGQEG